MTYGCSTLCVAISLLWLCAHPPSMLPQSNQNIVNLGGQ